MVEEVEAVGRRCRPRWRPPSRRPRGGIRAGDLVDDDRVEVIDFKTDLDRSTAMAYRTPVSVYYHVVAGAFPDRDVTDRLYTYHGTAPERIDPLSITELEQLVGARPRVRAA